MSDPCARIARAVLYEGYLLWPYRRSAPKNRQRWTFGCVFPPDWTAEHPDDPSLMRAELLVRGRGGALVDVRVRFLHVVDRQAMLAGEPVDEVTAGGERHLSWEEAAERELALGTAPLRERRTIPLGREVEELGDGASLVRSWEAIELGVELRSEQLGDDLHRVTLDLENVTPWDGSSRSEALRVATVSTHAVLRVQGGHFVSLTDPPAELREHAAACENAGVWPVLVGEPGSDDTVLASPIILSDHPQIAPESPGDLFDGGEIDELLILSVLRLTDAEQAEMRASDPRARAILDRCLSLSNEDLMRLHGRLADESPPDTVAIDGVNVRRGSRVVLRPRPGGDVFDVALAGRVAIVEGIDQDVEGAVQLAVTLEDDPGRDLGDARMPGHRFFYRADEVEPLAEPAAASPAGSRILVAGIGNVFLADDGFGVAVAQALAERALPAGVDVVDFGIRGMDLAYALGRGYDAAVLVDATPRGGEPGTVYAIEVEDIPDDVPLETHAMDPVRVLALARSLGAEPPRTVVVGCEPLVCMTGEEEDVVVELSPPVAGAVGRAVDMVEELVAELRDGVRSEVP
jgi:hydrogenase maturation protease